MSEHGRLGDEVIAAAFRLRALRGDPGDLHERILASTAHVTPDRRWQLRLRDGLPGPARRAAWTGLLVGAALLGVVLALVMGAQRRGPTAGPVEFLWSARGAGDGVYFPQAQGGGVAIDPSGQVWVVDAGHGRFAIFRPDGAFVEYWGTSGTADGQFHLSRSNGDALGTLGFAPDGSFYVLDVGNRRVQQFDRERRFVRSWDGNGTDTGRFSDPVGLAVDPDGEVLVLDLGRDVVETYGPGGELLGSFAPHVRGARPSNGLALDARGDIYVTSCCADGNEIRKFDPNGTLLASIGARLSNEGDQPGGLAVDAAGRLFIARGWAASRDKVQVFGPDGDLLAGFGEPGSGAGAFGYGIPLGIALDGLGNVYVPDGAGNRIQKFRLLPPLAP